MSRRYGRHQKRRAREQIAQLESDLAAARANFAANQSSMITNLRDELDAALYFQEQVITMVGHYSVLNQEPTLYETATERFRLAPSNRTLSAPSHFYPEVSQEDLRIQTLDCLRVKATREHFESAVRVTARLGGTEMCYAINNKAAMSMPSAHMICEIATELASAITRELKKLYPTRRSQHDNIFDCP